MDLAAPAGGTWPPPNGEVITVGDNHDLVRYTNIESRMADCLEPLRGDLTILFVSMTGESEKWHINLEPGRAFHHHRAGRRSWSLCPSPPV